MLREFQGQWWVQVNLNEVCKWCHGKKKDDGKETHPKCKAMMEAVASKSVV